MALLLVLGASFLMSGRARDNAESEAELRAQRYAVSGVVVNLTPELVSRDLVGSDFRDLKTSVDAGVMSDTDVLRVRIWKPNGDLIFSTAAGDLLLHSSGRFRFGARGLGLGLSIAKAIVERLGGTIGVTSVPGHTEFTIVLPQPPAEPGSEDQRPGRAGAASTRRPHSTSTNL